MSRRPKQQTKEAPSWHAEELYQALFEQSVDGVFITDAEGRYVEVNQHGCEMLGYTRAEVLGLSIKDMIFAENLAAEPLRLDQLRAGKTVLIERILCCKDGSLLPVEITARMLSDGSFLGMVRDITERKRAEKDLREAHQLLETIFDHTHLMVAYLDPQLNFIRVNRAYAQADERVPAFFPGKNHFDLYPNADNEVIFRRVAETGQAYFAFAKPFEYAAHLERGVSYWDWSLVPIKDPGGAVTGLIFTLLNVTDRLWAEHALRESEAKFRSIFTQSPIGIELFNAEGRLIDANPVCLAIFGAPSLNSMLGFNLFNDPNLPDAVKIKLLNNEPVKYEACFDFDLVKRMNLYETRKSGACYLDSRITPLVADTGTINGYLVHVHDITERKQAEKTRTRLEEQLRQSQKMESIGRLAGGVAHDFNNLLTVIQGYTDLMQDMMGASNQWVENLEQIRRASERAAALTRQLLAFSRQQVLTPTILDLNDLVANLHRMLGRLIGEDITLTTILQPELWSITADPGQIEQVIMNLVVNARDAMPTGGRLTVETGNVYFDDNYAQTHFAVPLGSYVMLAVTDTGHGMDRLTQAHIFEPFFTTKAPGKGTGLGLATVYGIVKQSGGEITVYSEPCQGTAFKIYLPATKVSPPARPARKPQRAGRGGHETILLVEDEEAVRYVLRRTLQHEGYTILEACSGVEALSVAGQHRGQIDLLLTDVIMPQMSGRELAEQLKILQPQLKVLFMSGYTNDAILRHGVLTAEIEFLTKPFSPNLLALKVREVLGV